MNFLSAIFFAVMPITCICIRYIPDRVRWIVLLCASWLLYFSTEKWLSLILLLEIAVTWIAAMGITRYQGMRIRQKLCMIVALLAVLCPIIIFRYTQFCVWIPAGISFFTFQMLSYVLDVYHGRFEAEHHLGYYALYVSFFPQLVAGPIERPGDLLPQLHNANQANEQDLHEGLWRLLRGYAKKILIADVAAIWVDKVYAAPGEASGPALVAATLLFALQIYCDFSGYSDIALGTARMLGIRLTENFNHPYSAYSVRDFWRRWHITLTRWLTDYVYKPLGGSKAGHVRRYINTVIVFLLSGIWHGTGWQFVVWGVMHGIAVATEQRFDRKQRNKHGFQRIITLVFVCAAWVFFRSTSISDACTVFTRLPVGWNSVLTNLVNIDIITVIQLAVGVILLHFLEQDSPKQLAHKEAVYTLVIAACILSYLAGASGGSENTFIYFRF